MKLHELKTIQPHFDQVFYGYKKVEVRVNDRDFKVRDILHLREYRPEDDTYSKNDCLLQVTHILYGGQYGIDKDTCVMSVELLKNR